MQRHYIILDYSICLLPASIVQCQKRRLHDCSEVRKNSDEFISVHLEAITNLIVY